MNLAVLWASVFTATHTGPAFLEGTEGRQSHRLGRCQQLCTKGKAYRWCLCFYETSYFVSLGDDEWRMPAFAQAWILLAGPSSHPATTTVAHVGTVTVSGVLRGTGAVR